MHKRHGQEAWVWWGGDALADTPAPTAPLSFFCSLLHENGIVKPLRIPRRPAWSPTADKDEFETNEIKSFLDWRRQIAE
jgi:hypothetical protein